MGDRLFSIKSDMRMVNNGESMSYAVFQPPKTVL